MTELRYEEGETPAGRAGPGNAFVSRAGQWRLRLNLRELVDKTRRQGNWKEKAREFKSKGAAMINWGARLARKTDRMEKRLDASHLTLLG